MSDNRKTVTRQQSNTFITKLKAWKTLPILLILLGMCLILAIVSSTFRTMGNVLNVLQQTSINAILAFGVSLVILIGGTDLSLGSVLAFSGMAMAMMVPSTGVIPAMIVAILIGAAFGALNGFFVSKLKLAPFIATMGSMSIGRGLTLVLSDGVPVSGMPDLLRAVSRGRIFGIVPAPVVIMLIVFVITGVVLKYTRFGRSLYAVGGNEEATRLSGINVDRIKFFAFVWSSALAGLAGIIQVARLNSAQPTAGVSYEMDAIAAAVIGGASLSGGSATAIGTLIGALIIGILRNGLNLLSVSTNWQQVVIGAVVVIAAALDMMKNRKN